MDQRKLTSFHEAGHAVMACMLGQPFKEVVVLDHDHAKGRMVFWKNQLMEDPAYVLMSLLAGCLAESMLAGGSPAGFEDLMAEHAHDMDEARRILEGAVPQERRESFGRELFEIVSGMLGLPPVWRCVENVAGLLERRGRVGHDEVMAHVKGIGDYLTGRFPGF